MSPAMTWIRWFDDLGIDRRRQCRREERVARRNAARFDPVGHPSPRRVRHHRRRLPALHANRRPRAGRPRVAGRHRHPRRSRWLRGDRVSKAAPGSLQCVAVPLLRRHSDVGLKRHAATLS